MADQGTQPGSRGRKNKCAGHPALARIFDRIPFVRFERYRPGNRRDIAVGEGDRHGLQMQLSASALVFEFVDRTLNKGARRDHDLIAGIHRRCHLRVDVISAMEDSALNGMG
jgi:hypothetical protein